MGEEEEGSKLAGGADSRAGVRVACSWGPSLVVASS